MDYFLAAYAGITNQELTIVDAGERPDFVCRTDDGEMLGIELARVFCDAEGYLLDQRFGGTFWRAAAPDKEPVTAFDIALEIYRIVEEKNEKRLSGDWRHHDSTVLLLQLVEMPLSEVRQHIDREMQDYFSMRLIAASIIFFLILMNY